MPFLTMEVSSHHHQQRRLRLLVGVVLRVLLLVGISSNARVVVGQFADQTSVTTGGTVCSDSGDCPAIQCLIPPCPEFLCVDGVCQVESNPPNPECVGDSDCPPIDCFAAPCDINVCNEGLCELQPPTDEDNLAADGEECGPVTCATGEVCCNSSCGICTEPDGVCTQQFCPQGEDGQTQECNDDSDCPPINCFVAPCDVNVCVNGACELQPPATTTDESEATADDNNTGTEGEECGPVMCAAGEVCCNFSCGICTEPDGFCTEQFCEQQQQENGGDDNSSTAGGNVLPCNTAADCPVLQCFAAPCDAYACNVTLGECVLVYVSSETGEEQGSDTGAGGATATTATNNGGASNNEESSSSSSPKDDEATEPSPSLESNSSRLAITSLLLPLVVAVLSSLTVVCL